MLKTQRENQTWLVSQPDHGRVAGYLAAHWGNDGFAAPGRFADSQNSEELRAETVLQLPSTTMAGGNGRPFLRSGV